MTHPYWGKKITKRQRSVEGKGKEEALPIFVLLIRVRTALGISYTLNLLNYYISLGKRNTLRVIHPTFFFSIGVLPGALQLPLLTLFID